jgi:hypothetical protein
MYIAIIMKKRRQYYLITAGILAPEYGAQAPLQLRDEPLYK